LKVKLPDDGQPSTPKTLREDKIELIPSLSKKHKKLKTRREQE
jgi:hypothetical protein